VARAAATASSREWTQELGRDGGCGSGLSHCSSEARRRSASLSALAPEDEAPRLDGECQRTGNTLPTCGCLPEPWGWCGVCGSLECGAAGVSELLRPHQQCLLLLVLRLDQRVQLRIVQGLPVLSQLRLWSQRDRAAGATQWVRFLWAACWPRDGADRAVRLKRERDVPRSCLPLDPEGAFRDLHGFDAGGGSEWRRSDGSEIRLGTVVPVVARFGKRRNEEV